MVKPMFPENGYTISEKFLSVLKDAVATDIVYVEECVSSHPEVEEKKLGFRPVSVKNTEIPSFLVVTYVKAEDGDGEYFYVVNRSLETEYVVSDEKEAKAAILTEMQNIISKFLEIENSGNKAGK